MKTRPRIAILLASVVAGFWAATTIDVIRRWKELAAGDFWSYWQGAHNLLNGVPIYPASQLSGSFVLGDAAFGRGFVYPPTAAVLASPLALVPLHLAFGIFTAASVVALGTVAYLILRREGADVPLASIATAAIVASGPGLDALLTGNVNALVAALLGAMWLRPRWSGYFAVAGGLIKVFPGVGLAWALRRRNPMVGPIAFGSLAVLATLPLGVDQWVRFAQTMANGVSTEYFVIESPRSLLSPVIGSTLALIAAFVLLALLLVAVLRLKDDRLAFLALSAAMIVLAPDWHLHYFVIPAVGALPYLAHRWHGVHVGSAEAAWDDVASDRLKSRVNLVEVPDQPLGQVD